MDTVGQRDAPVNDTLSQNTHIGSQSADAIRISQSAGSFNASTDALIALAPADLLRRVHSIHHINPVKTLPPIPLLSLRVDLIWYSCSIYPIAAARARALYIKIAVRNTLNIFQISYNNQPTLLKTMSFA